MKVIEDYRSWLIPSNMQKLFNALVLACLAGLAASASEDVPHDHMGKLTKYELGPPKIFLSADDLAQLREGQAVMQAAQQAGSQSRRLVMVQDIKTPHEVVMGCAARPRPPFRTLWRGAAPAPTAVSGHLAPTAPPPLPDPAPGSPRPSPRPGASWTSRSTTRW